MGDLITIDNVVAGVVSGLVASAIFLLALSYFRPRLKISPYIAKERDNKGVFYTFKVINLSRRPCINIRVDASIAKTFEVSGGITHWTNELKLNQTSVFEISGYRGNDINADYAWRFTTDDDISAKWKGHPDVVRFRIMATDPVSGFSRAYLQKYEYRLLALREGSHEFGLTLGVASNVTHDLDHSDVT